MVTVNPFRVCVLHEYVERDWILNIGALVFNLLRTKMIWMNCKGWKNSQVIEKEPLKKNVLAIW